MAKSTRKRASDRAKRVEEGLADDAQRRKREQRDEVTWQPESGQPGVSRADE